MKIDRALYTALNNQFAGLQVYHQPIVTADGQIIGSEALIRWNHDHIGAVPTGTFIPIAEERGHIQHIDNWMLFQVCRQLQQWRSQQHRDIFVSVNLSPLQFNDEELPERLASILEIHELPGSWLKLEITERILMDDPVKAIEIMNRLRELDIRISIDDFGIGYSSLSYLNKFPVDTLKIDRSFVTNVEHNEGSKNIVRTIISLANNMGLEILAEGVERHEQVSKIVELGCNIFQGYYFAKPMEDHRFWEMLAQDPQLPLHR